MKDICAICHDEYPNMNVDCCVAKYHIKCIDEWKLYSNSCPCCRAPLSNNRKYNILKLIICYLLINFGAYLILHYQIYH